MTRDLVIRAATEHDLDALVGLLGVLFALEADFSPEPGRQRRGLSAMLADPSSRTVLVAERGGAVIGMATAQLVVSTAEGGPSALVEDVVVNAAERGRGVGRQLLGALETWAAEHGASRLQLLADRENAPALGFYQRLGWRPTQLVCLRRHPPGGSRG